MISIIFPLNSIDIDKSPVYHDHDKPNGFNTITNGLIISEYPVDSSKKHEKSIPTNNNHIISHFSWINHYKSL